jgi:hypothetical protein
VGYGFQCISGCGAARCGILVRQKEDIAMGDMCTFFAVVLVIGVIAAVMLSIKKSTDEAALRKENPEVWMRKKELDYQDKQRKHERARMGFSIGSVIASALFRKYMK